MKYILTGVLWFFYGTPGHIIVNQHDPFLPDTVKVPIYIIAYNKYDIMKFYEQGKKRKCHNMKIDSIKLDCN